MLRCVLSSPHSFPSYLEQQLFLNSSSSTTMAATALSRSKGVARVRAAKGLFFFFTLLCLVSLSSSFQLTLSDFVDKKVLEELKENVKKAEKTLALEKKEAAMNAELMNFYAKAMDPLSDLMKKASKGLPSNFPSLERLMDSLKDFMEEAKDYADDEFEEFNEEMAKKEKKLEEAKGFLKMFEQQDL